LGQNWEKNKPCNMKRYYLLSAIVITVIFTDCTSPREITGVWINKEKIKGKSYSNIFIIVMTADIQARQRLESDLANVVTSKGLKAVKSVDVMPFDIDNPKLPPKEDVVNKIKESGCDAALISSVLNKEERINHTEGTTAYVPLTSYTPAGNYPGYYSGSYSTITTPSYYTHDKVYFMQSNLFDVASEEKMWAVESEVFNPPDIDKFSKSYTKILISRLKKARLIKK
jgi:hypothetical protein